MLPNTVYEQSMIGGHLTVLGKQPRIIVPRRHGGHRFEPAGFVVATQIGNQHGCQPTRVGLVRAASNETDQGFQQVISWAATGRQWLSAEGMLMLGTAEMLIWQSADCPGVIFSNSDVTLGLHAGRAALTNFGNGTVIDVALEQLRQYTDVTTLEVVIVGAICGKCFTHDSPEAQKKAQQLLDSHTKRAQEKIVRMNPERLGLDLRRAIKPTLRKAGIPKTNIHYPDLCTNEHPDLASHREHQRWSPGTPRRESNTFVVVRT